MYLAGDAARKVFRRVKDGTTDILHERRVDNALLDDLGRRCDII